ncbi:MAG: pyridoxal-dependent decarboxylase, partial [Myxococcota bacterium]
WVHVDGAFGLFARASRSKRHLTRGLDEADSWATDAHKWLNVPFDCGFAVVRHSAAHSAAMTQSAGYIAAETGARDPIDWNLEWSRRARSIPVYAALRELGSEGVEDLVNRCCAHCAALVSGLGNLDGAAVVAEPTLNQGLIRFCLPHTTPAEGDLFTERVIRAVNATGEAFFSPTTWDGRRVMRVSVVNWQTGPQDVARAVAAVKGALESTARSSSP